MQSHADVRRRPDGVTMEHEGRGGAATTARGGENFSPTPHFMHQASRVAELLDAGYSNRQIAARLGVSAPRISQIRVRLPSVEAYLGTPEPNARLRSHREQLWRLRHQALELAAAIRRDLRELSEEVEAAEIDRILGLR